MIPADKRQKQNKNSCRKKTVASNRGTHVSEVPSSATEPMLLELLSCFLTISIDLFICRIHKLDDISGVGEYIK